MAITTITAIRPPEVIGEGNKVASYKLAWGAYATGGCALDISGDFSYVYSVVWGGENAVGDGAYWIAPVFSYGTAVTATSIKLAVFWSDGAGSILAEITDATSLTALNGCVITVFGR